MKILRFISVLSLFIAIFVSCSTDVDLYSDYKDVPIIYAMLDSRIDTNYVKITRAFCGVNDDPIDASEVALIYDSCNYPGKLDARIIELKSRYGGAFEPTGHVFVLDTMTIHDKEEGTFYSPDQIVYYTTESFCAGTEGERYKYRLVVVKPDGDTVTALTGMVGNEEFSIVTSIVDFQMNPSDDLRMLIFRADGAGYVYEIGMRFNYREQVTGQRMKHKSVSRSYGTRYLSDFPLLNNTDNVYYVEYSVNWLFNALANAIGGDTIVDPDHPNVVRYFDGVEITVSAAGEDLYYYYLANAAQESSPVGFVSVYSNIDGGYGLFSSRATVKKNVKLSRYAQNELFDKTSWGFQRQ